MIKMVQVKHYFDIAKSFAFSNVRYISVAFIFVVAAFYSINIAQEGDTAKKDTKDQEKQVERAADLDKDVLEKSYPERFDSRAGDYYRVIIRAEANEDAVVDVYARSLLGVEKKIGGMTIRGNGSVLYEQVFATDDIYRDIILRRAKKTTSDDVAWDGVKISLSDVSVTRLDRVSQATVAGLGVTLSGDTKTSFDQLPTTLAGRSDRSLMTSAQRTGVYFESEASAVSSVYAKLSIIGHGGVGQYDVEISEYDANGSGTGKLVAKASFEADKLWKYADEDHPGLYRFDVPVTLAKGKLYFVGFSSKNVAVDEENGVELVRFGENEDGEGGGFIALGTARYTEVGSGKSVARLLTGATVQDIGSMYLYEYRMSHTEKDLLDVHATQGKPKYDAVLGMMTQSEADGAAFEYRIDTVHPFEKMNVMVVGAKDGKRGGFQVEYSYDGKDWQKVLPDDESGSQKADFIIHGQGGAATAFVRIVHYGKSQKNDVLGLSDFRVSALLKK